MSSFPSCRHDGVSLVDFRCDAPQHEMSAQREIARRLARVLGCRFKGEVRHDDAHAGRLGYAVPNDTITSLAQAKRMGLNSEHDLFGGVVPHPVVATKAITHPLPSAGAQAPAGWSAEFAERVSEATLPGWSAFTPDDARRAARALLHGGPVRLKLADDRGGNGQCVAHDPAEVDEALATFGEERIAHGVVIERDLAQVRTLSIGLLQAGSLLVSYHGTQRLTTSRRGESVYGGSSLTFVRGDLGALRRATAGEAQVQQAIALAQTYHAAALDCFAGMFASRCNYDVALGTDAAGISHAGVLESSWRIGGASGAEVLALQALQDDPSVQQTQASTVEVHGKHTPPSDAFVLFCGEDEHLGPLCKYAKAGLHDQP